MARPTIGEAIARALGLDKFWAVFDAGFAKAREVAPEAGPALDAAALAARAEAEAVLNEPVALAALQSVYAEVGRLIEEHQSEAPPDVADLGG